MSWYSLLGDLLNGSPACPECGRPMAVAGEDLVHDSPPVLETRYRCLPCAEEIVRCDVMDWA